MLIISEPHFTGEKAASSTGRGPARSSAGPGGRGVSLDITNTGKIVIKSGTKIDLSEMWNDAGRTVNFDANQNRNKLQKSQSFGFNSSSQASSGSGSVRGRPGREPQVRQRVRERSSSGEMNPLQSLPTSHTKTYHKNMGSPPPHSPSPSQSEYDTCDPWDDYWVHDSSFIFITNYILLKLKSRHKMS